MSETILSVKDLKVNYGGIEAVKGISFDVPKGSVVTLIGANGAGKSTTLKAIAGLVKPASGSISFKGESITGKDPSLIVSKGIVLVPEGRRVFDNMTVLENIKIGAYLRHDDLSEDMAWCLTCSRGSRSANGSCPVRSPAASSRCSRSPEVSWRGLR